MHARDCEDCESSSGRIDEFRSVATLAGDVSDEQHKRVLKVAD
ncbi:MAG: hypothetical protein AAGI72_02955 [Pseudomonadota bacterium]